MRPEEGEANYGLMRSGNERDLLNDNSRDGGKVLRKQDCGFEMNFGPVTLEEEIEDGGWNRIQQPVPADPQDVSSSGGRGEPGTDYDEPRPW